MKMNKTELINQWYAEEKIAHIHGWDFSHIHGKYDEENDLPWDYEQIVRNYIKPNSRILDIDTGGGEFLLSLHHPYNLTSATEAYPPNVKLCEETLLPLGIDFKEADGNDLLPFDDGTFDIVINRHGDFNPTEIARVLKPGGLLITEQVGAENDRDLAEMILPKLPELPFPDLYLEKSKKRFIDSGFDIIDGQEAYRPIKFFDVGALVWFAHIIEWEFPNFTVKGSLDKLLKAQEVLENQGVIEGTIHRYLLVAKKL